MLATWIWIIEYLGSIVYATGHPDLKQQTFCILKSSHSGNHDNLENTFWFENI